MNRETREFWWTVWQILWPLAALSVFIVALLVTEAITDWGGRF